MKEVIIYIAGRTQSLKAIFSFHAHPRAFIKIQQGCSNPCSYCIITAGRGYSREGKEVMKEVKKLIPFYPELVITGTHLGSCKDVNIEDLASLLRKLLKKTQSSRVRLSSIEINEIIPGLLFLFHYPLLTSRLHIPLQTGSDRILKFMKRQYMQRSFFEKTENIKQVFPNIALITDMIVRVPLEKREDFEYTLSMAEKIGFLKVHIPPYSAREKAEATILSPRVPGSIKKKWKKILGDTAALSSLNFRKKFIGAEKRVILGNKEKDGRLSILTTFNPIIEIIEILILHLFLIQDGYNRKEQLSLPPP